MSLDSLPHSVAPIAERFSTERQERQQRRHLEKADFDDLARVGFTRAAVPIAQGGLWETLPAAARPICQGLRTLATGDSSVALVCAMHPAVLSYWLVAADVASPDPIWKAQCETVFQSAQDGHWWGTLTSEPGSGGDVLQTRTRAQGGPPPTAYRLSGSKHFGSGSGMMSYMVTTALPDGETEPDWFFLDMRDASWDGTEGLQLLAEWDGQGMTATQSHAFEMDACPAVRIAWPGNLPHIISRTGGFIGCLFTSVVVGILDAALRAADAQLRRAAMTPYQTVEWTRIQSEAWLVEQAFEGILRAVESQTDSRSEVLLGKTAIAELAESMMTRVCRVCGGSTFSRRSPFGFWFEDVRALGFLRPPWSLAFETLARSWPD